MGRGHPTNDVSVVRRCVHDVIRWGLSSIKLVMVLDTQGVKNAQLSSNWSITDGGVESPAQIVPERAEGGAPAAGVVYVRDHIVIGDVGATRSTETTAKPGST